MVLVWFAQLWMGCGTSPPLESEMAPTEVVEEVEEDASEAEVVEGPNAPPSIRSINISPSQITTLTDVVVTVEAVDPDDARIDVDMTWVLNGNRLLHRTAELLPHTDFSKGDRVQVEVRVSDGHKEVLKMSEPMRVENAPPAFVTDPRLIGSLVGATIEAEDPDEDVITYKLRGAPNGMQIHPKTGVITYEGSKDEKGGNYRVRVIAEDPEKANVQWEVGLTISPGAAAVKKAKEKTKAESVSDGAE